MKKFLIALPLVLIMILSMIPVMAANKDLSVAITYYKEPAQKNELRKEVRVLSIDEAIMKDAKALKAEVEKQVKALGFPKLGAKVEPDWTVEATVTAAGAGKDTYVIANKPFDAKLATLKAEAAANGITVEMGTDVAPADIEGDVYVQDGAISGYNAIVAKFGNDFDAAKDKLVIAKADLTKEAPSNKTIDFPVKQAGEATAATASAIAYPNCIVDPTSKETAVCAALCSEIKVQIEDVFNKVILKDFTRVFKVDKNKYPSFEAIFKTYMAQFFPVNDYQIVNTWYGQPWVEIPGVLPTQIDKDCTITLKVIPLLQKVNVIHVLNDCCTSPDGQVSKRVFKKFVEQGVAVDFIKYHTELLIDNAKAAEFAQTRLQKINALDFVFVGAKFDSGINLDGYMTGEVYDLNGKKVATIENTLPTITLIYDRAECAEEKVDNATVGNTNTTNAPATAAGTQLPATGAKDVTAFFMSAVALLGLGIFFAKKH